jgi:ATP-dependent DNA helicase RecG
VKEVARFIAETLCAFANADGGVLLVGQEDLVEGEEQTTGTVTGVDYPTDKQRLLLDVPNYLIVPPLSDVVVSEDIVNGVSVLLFEAASSHTAHRLTDGKCLLRVGDRNVPYSEHQISLLKQNQSPYERRSVPGASVADLDTEALQWFSDRIGWGDDVAAMLRAYRLCDGDHVNRACVLLFAKDPLRWQDHTDVTVVRYAGTERGLGGGYQASSPKRIEAPLVRLIEHAYSSVAEQLRRRVGLRDLFFSEEMEYPKFAWQEAIINAVAHRDYLLLGAGIEVWLFDDRLEVRSPGPPPAPVTIEALQAGGRVHYSRNPLMARVLTDCGYMREQGEGIPRIFAEMASADLLPPALSMDGFRFVVTLRNTPVWDAETRRWLESYAAFDLSREQKRLLAFAHAHGNRFTNREAQKQLGMDLYAVSTLVKALMRNGIVRLTEKGGRIYEVLPVGVTEPIPDTVVALLPAFNQRETLANRDLQEAWGLDRAQAYQRARSLVAAGWLEMEGSKRAAVYRLAPKTRFTNT